MLGDALGMFAGGPDPRKHPPHILGKSVGLNTGMD